MGAKLGRSASSTRRDSVGEVVPIGAARIPGRFSGIDAQLVEALCRGEPGARSELVARYGVYVECVLARIMGPDHELPDLLHNVFIIALGRISTLLDPNLLKEWLRGITLQVARNTLRSRRRRRWLTFMAPEELPEVSVEGLPADAAEALLRTYQALAKLPVDERIAFTLRFIDGMELRDVASACSVSLSTAKRRLDRAQDRFAALGRRDPVLRELMARGRRWGAA